MQVSADRQCQFSHPDFNQSGRWYGICEDGLAAGRGYGLVMSQRGDTVEFIGDAKAGFASGSGGMIVQRKGQLGATYYEGSFNRGLPDGVVMVEQAGALPKLRQYKAGTDIGKGSPSNLKGLDFAGASAANMGVSP